MESRSDLRAAIDRARLMIRLSVIGGVLATVLFVLVLVLAVIRESFGGSDLFAMAVLPLALAVLFSIASLIYGMLGNSAAIEDEEKYLLASRKENRLLNVEEDVRFTAGRSFDNYKKFAPYVVTVLAALLTGVLLFSFNRYWDVRLGGRVLAENPLNSALVAGILMFVSIFSGAFFVGQSRAPSFRWLRPLGSWLIAASGVLLLAAIALICSRYKIEGFDAAAAKVVFGIFAIFCIEFVINFIIEFYRPRTSGEAHPLFESRLLSLFTEPGGVMRNLADALDYQFGFKVSGTWIYGFIERSLFPLLILWGAIFWLTTSIYEVGPNEVGIRERFGRVVSTTPLKAGVYLDLPWPFGNINRFSCDRVYSVNVGVAHAGANGKVEKVPEVVTWTKTHIDNENMFLIAVAPQGEVEKPKQESESASVAFIGMNMPVQYRIRESEIMDYAYGNRDPQQILKRLSEQVATEYLASCELMHVMSDNRVKAADAMKTQIQALVDADKLGIEIISVNLLDVHPPVEKVAPAFQDVIGAMEKKEAAVLEAKAYSVRIVPEAESAALKTEQDAISYRYRIKTVAEAESQRFFKQLQSYQAMPSMFVLNERLLLLERDAADLRKFIISSSLQNEIYELNFEEKARLDLIDADLGSLVSKN